MTETTAAASVLQRAWRRHTPTSALMAMYFARGPAMGRVRGAGCADLVGIFGGQEMLSITRRAVVRILFLCMHDRSGRGATAPLDVRSFILSTLLVNFPAETFDRVGQPEMTVLRSANRMLGRFEMIGVAVLGARRWCDVGRKITRDFPQMLLDYFVTYEAWNRPDYARHVSMIKHTLAGLYRQRLGGGDVAAMIADTEGRLAAAVGWDGLARFQAGHEEEEAAPAAAEGWQPPLRVPAEALAHELLIVPGFELSHEGTSHPISRGLRVEYEPGFWRELEDDVRRAPPGCARLMRVLVDLRDGLRETYARCATAGDGILQVLHVDHVLDVDYVRLHALSGSLSWSDVHGVLSGVMGLMLQAQEPLRAEALSGRFGMLSLMLRLAGGRDDARPEATRRALETLVETLNAMRVDAANALLRRRDGEMRDRGFEIERDAFVMLLHDGLATTGRTRAWLYRAVGDALDSGVVTLPSLLAEDAAAYARVHDAALYTLLISGTTAGTCPETLALDAPRLWALHLQYRYIWDAAAMLVCAAPTLASAGRAAATSVSKYFRQKHTAVDQEDAIRLIREALSTPAVPEAERERVLALILANAAPGGKIHALVGGRVRALLRRLAASGADARGTERGPGECSPPRPAPLPHDLAGLTAARPLALRMHLTASMVQKMAIVNRCVHGRRYGGMILEAAMIVHHAREAA